MKIVASGILYGLKEKVECNIYGTKISFAFNGQKEPLKEREFQKIMKKQNPIGGTYYPPVNSALNVYNVLENYYFDKLISIECDEPLDEIPFEDGRIY